MRWLGLLAALAALPAAAKVPVVVLYFDNNTPGRENDVLSKGLADMLITDLSGSETLEVVEREKLESLVGELQLQRSKYFDARTAQKVGKMVGARYAVTGAFTAWEPELRLDVRLLEVESAKVVVGHSVRGRKERFFELEEELVKKFLSALAASLPAAGGRRSGTADFAAVLQYGRALDTQDQGDLKAASMALARVVRDAPDFTLAKARYAELLRRLREAGKRRDEALGGEEQELVKGLEAGIAKGAGRVLEEVELEPYFCFRAMRTAYLLWKLEQVLQPPAGVLRARVAAKADRARAVELAKAVWDNEVALIDDATRNHRRLEFHNHAVSCPMALHRAGSKDFYRLKPLGIPWYPMPGIHPAERAEALARFATVGRYTRARFDDQEDELPEVRALPALVTVDPSYGPKALAQLDAAQKHLELPASRNKEQVTLSLEATRALVQLRLGRREDAIATLQAFLDRYPKSTRYKAVEAQVELLLGVSEQGKRDADAVRACRATDTQLQAEVDRRFDAEGAKSVLELVQAVAGADGGCGAFAARAAAVGAWYAAQWGECAAAKALVPLAGSEDVAGARALCE